MSVSDSLPGDPALVTAIRDASRRMVRELGFMGATLADTALPPSAVHALIELGAAGEDAGNGLTATDLAERLNLEKSSVSRLLRKRIEAGDIAETQSGRDGRAKTLTLTGQGRRLLSAIDAFGQKQVATALDHLAPDERQTVAEGLAFYAQALAAARTGEHPPAPASDITIAEGYHPGVVGRIAEMHARYYARAMGFGQVFESKVATQCADFVARLDRPRNGLWVALRGEQILGTVVIDGEDLAPGIAHLRWFILDDAARGTGIGRRLLQRALAFCDRQGFETTMLWTIRGLDAARHLYEDTGFTLVEEWSGDQWGRDVREQKYSRPHPQG